MMGTPPPLPNGEIINRWKVKFVDVHSSMFGVSKARELWGERPVFLTQTWFMARQMAAIYFAVQISEVDLIEIQEGETYDSPVQVSRKKGNGLIVVRESDSKISPPGTDQ